MEQNIEKYRAFRDTYPEFIYESYELEAGKDELQAVYHFRIPGLAEFAPKWRIPLPEGEGKLSPLLEKMVFSLGMVELVSYWKITCSPRVLVKAGYLDREQILWWKNLYFNGLGEFFYVNGLWGTGLDDFMEIDVSCTSGSGEEGRTGNGEERREDAAPGGKMILEGKGCPDRKPGVKVLVPIGGGKDSAVTLELLKEAGARRYGYVINPREATVRTAEAAGLPKERVISVKRTLDPRMLELNRQGFLNGHTPFSAVVAFSSLIAAELYGLPFIALSNESSANESTVLGSTVNHQYSKSFQFEQDFHQYAARYLPGSGYYFSMLRPLSEFQIAKYFAGCRAYHGIFKSCNAGSKKDIWCGHCPKCLFVFLILSPFLSQEELTGIFGKNLLEDESLYETLKQLTGLLEEKPFECVGSRGEVNTAIVLAVRRLEEEGKPLPLLLERYKGERLYEEYRRLGDRYSGYFDQSNLLPGEWESLVRSRCCEEAGR